MVRLWHRNGIKTLLKITKLYLAAGRKNVDISHDFVKMLFNKYFNFVQEEIKGKRGTFLELGLHLNIVES